MLGIDSRVARITWTVVVVLLFLGLIYAVRHTLFVFTLAILLSYLMAPLVDLLDRYLPGKRRTLALALAYILVVVLVVGAVVAIGARVADEATQLAKVLPETVKGWVATVQARIPASFNVDLAGRASALLATLPSLVLGFVAIASNLIYVVIIPVLSFFFLKDGHVIRQHILGLVDTATRRTTLDSVLADIHLLLAHYMRALVLLSMGTFSAYTIFLSMFGVPYSLLLGALAGALEFIPMIGPLSAVVIVLATAGSVGHFLAVGIFVAAYRIFQDYVASPHLMGQGVELHPLLVLFGVFAGAEIAGVEGTFLSVPVLALARIVYRHASRNVTPVT
jgi:predicted PurR-regulated permease PerM